MGDVDPRDFIDFYRVQVKPSSIGASSLSKDDFDEDSTSKIYSTETVDGEFLVEFTSELAAQNFVEELNSDLDFLRYGFLHLRTPHPEDPSDVDAYLSFSER